MASAAEREMRQAVVARCREYWPDGRVIHELAIGGCRADLAVVTRSHLFAFEIKSSRDKLDRLENQFRFFDRATHGCFVVADARWFETFSYDKGGEGFRPCEELRDYSWKSLGLWCYPEPEKGDWRTDMYRWRKPGQDFRFDERRQPRAGDLLGILLKEELMLEARRHGVDIRSRWSVLPIISAMAFEMTGKQVAEAVCRQLRMRRFARADPPVTPDGATPAWLDRAEPLSDASDRDTVG